jgi:hypothetical protein
LLDSTRLPQLTPGGYLGENTRERRRAALREREDNADPRSLRGPALVRGSLRISTTSSAGASNQIASN